MAGENLSPLQKFKSIYKPPLPKFSKLCVLIDNNEL